jgi:hypothetical protein
MVEEAKIAVNGLQAGQAWFVAVVVDDLQAKQTSAVEADGLEEADLAPIAAASVRVRLAVSGRVIMVAARLVSSGSLGNDDGLGSGACSREPFRVRLRRGRLRFWRWLRRLFGCCCEGSGCRFRCLGCRGRFRRRPGLDVSKAGTFILVLCATTYV